MSLQTLLARWWARRAPGGGACQDPDCEERQRRRQLVDREVEEARIVVAALEAEVGLRRRADARRGSS